MKGERVDRKSYSPSLPPREKIKLMPEIQIKIESEDDYERLEAVLNKLFNKSEEDLSPEERKLLEPLRKLLEDHQNPSPPVEKS